VTTIPQVDTDTLKICWQIRKESTCTYIDEVIFRQACKPGADVVSAVDRAAFLEFIVQAFPEFAEFMPEGRPSDALLEVCARFPLTVGVQPMDISGLLRELKTKKPVR
jgi:hypothetical protein